MYVQGLWMGRWDESSWERRYRIGSGSVVLGRSDIRLDVLVWINSTMDSGRDFGHFIIHKSFRMLVNTFSDKSELTLSNFV